MSRIAAELAKELQVAEDKAWDSLARYKFQMFGYWAAIWVHLNRIGGFKRPADGPELERRSENQRPKTHDWKETKLYRYVGTDLFQWYGHKGGSVFEDPSGEPFRVHFAPTAPVEASGSEQLWSVGSWLSAALDDPKVCDAMKSDIRDWFDNGGHLRPQPSGETR